jgi:hypothetical protein
MEVIPAMQAADGCRVVPHLHLTCGTLS